MFDALRLGSVRSRHIPMPSKAVSTGAVVGVSVFAAGVIYLAQRAKALKQTPRVRDAGPENMKNPPRDWDCVDQALDESFPCSDPAPHSR